MDIDKFSVNALLLIETLSDLVEKAPLRHIVVGERWRFQSGQAFLLSIHLSRMLDGQSSERQILRKNYGERYKGVHKTVQNVPKLKERRRLVTRIGDMRSRIEMMLMVRRV